MSIDFVSQNTVPLTDEEYKDAAALLKVEVAAIKAVAFVESMNSGFLLSKRPRILFESRVFHSRTGGVFDIDHPDISTHTWVKNYKGGELEYERLEKAMKLDELAALASCSWGKFQIMGFNYAAAGYGSIESFVRGMVVSERCHLLAFVSCIKTWELAPLIKHHRWSQFAERYNGPAYAQNKYDEKLLEAYVKFTSEEKAA